MRRSKADGCKNEFPSGKVIKYIFSREREREHRKKNKKKLPTVLAISHEGASYFDERADISLAGDSNLLS